MHLPQHATLLGGHRGCPGHAVEHGELAEAVLRAQLPHGLVIHGHFEAAALDDVPALVDMNMLLCDLYHLDPSCI